MTEHDHTEFDPNCYRCDLNLDELGEPLRVEWPCPVDSHCECQCHDIELSSNFREICACRA